MKSRSEETYARDVWGHGSGQGSLPKHARGYVRVLQQFLRDNRIVHVVDLGCGDWPFSRMMDWNGVEYLGLDLVESVIARNRQEYTTANIHFQVISGDLGDLPAADLLIAKDVLQHWANASVASFLPVLRRYRFSLITNCVNPKGATLNEVIIVGDFRFLDLRLPPFNVHAEEIFSFVKHRPF
jgi:2-polyprenyl-3-methyl-5-hydroxy-6-metoxy-1,4-benzoquinol methylase